MSQKSVSADLQLDGLDVIVTRAFESEPPQKRSGILAWFSFNILSPSGRVVASCNQFTVRREYGRYVICSPYKVIFDPEAPEDIPDDDAVKPLYYTSFFPGKSPEQIEARKAFGAAMADAVFRKINYFRSLKSNNEPRNIDN